MTSENFVYWLRGYLELRQDKNSSLTVEQVKMIEEHLALVLRNVSNKTEEHLIDRNIVCAMTC